MLHMCIQQKQESASCTAGGQQTWLGGKLCCPCHKPSLGVRNKGAHAVHRPGSGGGAGVTPGGGGLYAKWSLEWQLALCGAPSYPEVGQPWFIGWHE